MSIAHRHAPRDSGPPRFWRSRYAVGFLVLGAVALFYLVAEHKAHLLGALPYLLLLAGPLMHVFMHGGHGGHGGRHGRESGDGKRAPNVASPDKGDRP
ncbi:MAG: DUF2933 domain-containing protein [Steroidobacteraceae bacterium]|nr:DUF2933 domain-containing protein [Steroidobacteraceae bacterium]